MRWNTDPRSRFGRPLRARRSATPTPAGLLEGLEQRALLAVDLFYHGIAVANNTLPGGSIQVNSTVDNLGDTVAADDFDVAFYLSQNDTFDAGSDIFLGTFGNDVEIPAMGDRGFPIDLAIPAGTAEGDWFVIGIADSGGVITETDEANNTLADAFFIGNTAPVIGATSVSPTTVGSQGEFTLQALNVSDADDITGVLNVRFYLDDGDDVFSPIGDTLLGDAELEGDVYTFKGAVPAGLSAGEHKVIAVANDGLDDTAAFQAFTVVVAAPPTLGDLAAPATARRGRDITLTASEVAGMTPSVEFYRDVDGNGDLDPAVDQLLGASPASSDPTHTLDVTIDPAWGAAAQTFFARAVDSLGQPSAAEEVSVALLVNRRPKVARLVPGATTISKGEELTLTARNVRDDDEPVQAVRFYRESSGNSTLNPAQDTLIGEGTQVGNTRNWAITFTVPLSFSNGLNRFYVRAVDAADAESFTKTAVVRVTRNARPAIDAFNINKTTVASGGRVQFLAQRVTDNGSLDRVEFWYDADENGIFNAANDRLITTGRRLGSSDNWRRRINLPGDLPTGPATFFAVAFDNLGARGTPRTDTLTIT